MKNVKNEVHETSLEKKIDDTFQKGETKWHKIYANPLENGNEVGNEKIIKCVVKTKFNVLNKIVNHRERSSRK